MKLKTWHLFLVIAILFGCSFYVVNLKFDKFSRVNGINNDNRALIEKYLDDDEQTYLVENQVPIDKFIDYIEEDGFCLENYQFYNALTDTNRYRKKKVIEIGNSLSTRLTYLYSDRAFEYAQELIARQMENAFLSESSFQFDNIEYYTYLKPLYTNYDYIGDGNTYVNKLKEMGIQKSEDLLSTFQTLTTAYSADSLKKLMDSQLDKNIHLVLNPLDDSIIVDKQHYIANYEPKDLLMVQDVPRVRYAMYLQKDAYNALVKMYQAASENYSGFVLKEAYVSPQSLDDEEVGYNEYQLGLTVDIFQSQVNYQDFNDTELSDWLEQHAYEYGFILRYPKNKASITNHAYDAHTYRYVGKELATQLYNTQMTLEEYQLQKK